MSDVREYANYTGWHDKVRVVLPYPLFITLTQLDESSNNYDGKCDDFTPGTNQRHLAGQTDTLDVHRRNKYWQTRKYISGKRISQAYE